MKNKVARAKGTHTHVGGATAPQHVRVSALSIANKLLRFYMSGGALIITTVLYFTTWSLWSLAAMLPWLALARFFERMK